MRPISARSLVSLAVLPVFAASMLALGADSIDPPEEAVSRTASDTVAELAVLAAGTTGGSTLLAAADALATAPDNVRALLHALDENRDGLLSFDEVLQARPLASARTARPSLVLPDPPLPDTVPGADATLDPIAGAFLEWLEGFLQLGIANEADLPAIPIDGLAGDPAAMLADVPRAALRTVADVLADLDAAADMAHGSMRVNEQRKAILMRDVQKIFPHFDAGRIRVVRRQLEWLRDRTDGRRSPPDWVVGPAADRLLARIDRILVLLPE
jgi:hypothetical protein